MRFMQTVVIAVAMLLSAHSKAQLTATIPIGAVVENVHFEKGTRLAFVRIVNTSGKDISGLNLSIDVAYQKGPYHYERLLDFAPKIISQQMTGQEDNGALHPKTAIEERIDLPTRGGPGNQPIAVTVKVDVVAYLDATADVGNDAAFQRLLNMRHNRILADTKAAEIINEAAPTVQNGMGSEETTVRNTYARLKYACEVGVLAKAVIFNGKKFPGDTGPTAGDQKGIERELARQLDLELKDFRIGDVAEIKDKPLASLITVPGADSFKLVNEGANYSVGSQFSTTNTTISWVSIRWRSNQEAAAYSKEVSDEVSQKTVGDLIAQVRVPYARYASFSVHATLQGKSISYNTLFLFPKDPHADLWPIDTVIGSELIGLNKAPLYPGALVETTFRELPVVRAWVDSHRVSSCPVKGQRAVCCDPQTGICGLDDETLQKAMDVPVDPMTRDALPKGKAQ